MLCETTREQKCAKWTTRSGLVNPRSAEFPFKCTGIDLPPRSMRTCLFVFIYSVSLSRTSCAYGSMLGRPFSPWLRALTLESRKCIYIEVPVYQPLLSRFSGVLTARLTIKHYSLEPYAFADQRRLCPCVFFIQRSKQKDQSDLECPLPRWGRESISKVTPLPVADGRETWLSSTVSYHSHSATMKS